MKQNIMDTIAAEVERVYGVALEEVTSIARQDPKEALLRRFSANYDKLGVEQIEVVRTALGHQDGEKNPCKACRLIARKEFALAEE